MNNILKKIKETSELILEIEINKNGAVLIYASNLYNDKLKRGLRLVMVGGAGKVNKIDLAFIKLFKMLDIEAKDFIYNEAMIKHYFYKLGFNLTAMATLKNGSQVIILN
jgi:hypothetical protein